MNARRDPERLIHAFLMEVRTELADEVYDAVRASIEQKRQRVVIGPWRFPDMNKFVPIGLGAAAVVVALVASSQLLTSPAPGGTGGVASAGPTPTTQPTPTASPSLVPSPSAIAGLPEGPFVVSEGSEDEPSVTVTIPASGWDHDRQLKALGKGDETANLPEAAILFWGFPAGTEFHVYRDPCQWQSTRPDTPVTTVDEFAAALAAQADRDASALADVTVGGYAGKSMALHVPDDAVFADCDEGNFASYEASVEPGTPSRFHQGPGQIDELWILDVDGAIVVIDAMYSPNTPADLIEEMRAIAESATFGQGGGS